jgi:hypothetical protein
VGLILISDGGAQERIAYEVMRKLFKHKLHPIQFEEVTALMFAKKTRSFNRDPKYVLALGGGPIKLIQMPLAGLSDNPIFGDFDRDLFAQMLAEFTSHSLSAINPDPENIMTWIGDFNDPMTIDVVENPWP